LKRPFMVLTPRPHKVNGISVRVVNWNSMHDPSACPCLCVCVCVCVSGPHVSLSQTLHFLKGFVRHLSPAVRETERK